MIRLDYKFDGEWFHFNKAESYIIEALMEFVEQKYMVKLDGTISDVSYLLHNLFNVDLEDLADSDEFGEFIHNKFEEEARDAFDEQKEEELLAAEPW